MVDSDNEPTEYEIEDGRVIVFKRANSRFWQMRTTISGDRIWRSLKTTDAKKAVQLARREFYKLETLQEAGQPIKQLKMGDMIKAFSETLDMRLEKKLISQHMHKKYSYALRIHITPYFEKMNVNSIDTNAIDEFFEERINAFDDPPSHVTVLVWGGTLRKLLEFGLAKDYIKKIPEFTVPETRPSDRRPCFTRDEWNTLLTKLPEWVESGIDRYKYNRQVLAAYIQILGMTGMRTNDARKLRWEHIAEFRKKGIDPETDEVGILTYVSIRASGKPSKNRKTRELTGQPHCVKVIRAWKAISKFTQPNDLVFCIERDAVYTCTTLFKQMLTDFGMLNDNMGDARTPYSIRHTYATTRLESGTPIHLLANQMGTSVEMIEKHYGHIQIRDNVDKLAQRRSHN